MISAVRRKFSKVEGLPPGVYPESRYKYNCIFPLTKYIQRSIKCMTLSHGTCSIEGRCEWPAKMFRRQSWMS